VFFQIWRFNWATEMAKPDFESAKTYALERLALELPHSMVYHSLTHTRDEVVPAIEVLARLEGISEEDLLLLRTAAYFHDIGYIVQSLDHEEASAIIAQEALSQFGYNPEQIETIKILIMSTKLPQSPQTLLEQIMADADLDVLGSSDYIARNQQLRDEFAATGREMSDEEWYTEQLSFIKSHEYFTQAARYLRNERKQQNTHLVVKLLAQTQVR
jgi:uncharacterized protein